jgi:hypothetical protein
MVYLGGMIILSILLTLEPGCHRASRDDARWGRALTRPAGGGGGAPARLRRARARGAPGHAVDANIGEGGVADGWPPSYSAGWHDREPAGDAWAS